MSEAIEPVAETIEQSNEHINETNTEQTPETTTPVGELKATDFQDLDNLPETKPPTMSKSQWKKLQRKKKFQEHKKEYIAIRKIKKKEKAANRREEIAQYKARNEPIPDHLIKKPRKPPANQKPTGTKIIIDCSFDELMNDKEKVSLSSQITRSYSANRTSLNTVDLEITSFGGNLKKRFDVTLASSAYQNWTNITFNPEPFTPVDKMIYLSADATEALDTLEPDMTYVIGGIVDKGRYKYLCKNKAEEMGLKCKRLPIDEYIQLFGRQVLTTTHVVELMLEWFNEGKDWKKAFEKVLPQRKLIVEGEEVNGLDEEREGEVDEEEEDVVVEEGVEKTESPVEA